jgi:glycosyltransferase involved in cell wall biosynthesis
MGKLLGTQKAGAEIKSLLKQPNLVDRVVFMEGFITDQTIDALCELADLAVFPHERMAGQSGAVTRAAGCGVPVLVSDVGGLATLAIDSRFIVPPGDREALARNLSALLGEDLRALRSPQIAHIGRFDWGAVAALHAQLFRQLSGSSP